MNTIIEKTEVTLDTKPTRNKNAKAPFCITDGKVYASVTDAAEAEHVSISIISAACRGKTKTANGKQWCFVKDMPSRILDISNSIQSLIPDAEAYKEIEAERREREQRQLALQRLERETEELMDQLKELDGKKLEVAKKIDDTRRMKEAMRRELYN